MLLTARDLYDLYLTARENEGVPPLAQLPKFNDLDPHEQIAWGMFYRRLVSFHGLRL